MKTKLKSAIWRYGLALGLLAVTLAFNAALLYFSIRVNLAFLVALILIAATWYGGWGPGLLQAVLVQAVIIAFNPSPPNSSPARIVFGHISVFLLLVFIVLLTGGFRRLERRLRRSEERYRALASSAQMVWIADGEGNLSEPPQNWTEITGLTDESAKDDRWLESVHPDEREETLRRWKQSVESRKIYEIENRILSANGEYRYFQSRGVPVFDEEGGVREWVVMSLDITERKEAENEILRLNETLEQRVAERTLELQAVNKELEAFAYSVSHDLRAPLRAMDGFSFALLEDYDDRLDEEGKNYLNRIRLASQKMAQLIDDMLKLARVSRGELKRENVILSDLAREIAERLRESQAERAVKFEIEEPVSVLGDERLLRIALENLLGNAWKFTSKCEDAEIVFGQKQSGDKNVYFVKDNGAGFDMNYANKLFGAFQRLHGATEFEGTGIGLATVQRIINRHGGNIWAEAEVGKGACFYFNL